MTTKSQTNSKDTPESKLESTPKRVKKLPQRAGTIGFEAVKLIKSGKADNQVIEEIMKKFPQSKFGQSHVAYYKSVMRANGIQVKYKFSNAN